MLLKPGGLHSQFQFSKLRFLFNNWWFIVKDFNIIHVNNKAMFLILLIIEDKEFLV